MSGQRRGVAAGLLRAALWSMQWPYRGGVACKNFAFESGLRRPFDPSVPVISVGNITTGGTGKTPVVAFLANWFRDAGLKVGLLSRGYKSLTSQVNDEKLVLDQLCPGLPHWLNSDRIQSAKQAVHEAGCEMLVLDDAFQHRRIRRDLDIVLIDALNPWGYGHCLPRGLLREPVSSIRRADLVFITRADLVHADELTAIRAELVRHQHVATVVELAFKPTSLVNCEGESRSLIEVVGKRCVGFCGIGNPASFDQTLRRLGANVVDFVAFPDHHHFSEANLEQLAERAKFLSADILLATQKDLVKLNTARIGGLPCWAVTIGPKIIRGDQVLEHHLWKLMGHYKR